MGSKHIRNFRDCDDAGMIKFMLKQFPGRNRDFAVMNRIEKLPAKSNSSERRKIEKELLLFAPG